MNPGRWQDKIWKGKIGKQQKQEGKMHRSRGALRIILKYIRIPGNKGAGKTNSAEMNRPRFFLLEGEKDVAVVRLARRFLWDKVNRTRNERSLPIFQAEKASRAWKAQVKRSVRLEITAGQYRKQREMAITAFQLTWEKVRRSLHEQSG